MFKKACLPALLGAVVLSACSKKTHSEDTPLHLKIAYNVPEDREEDDYDVYVMNFDGSGASNITRHPDVAWTYHAWKDQLFFISDRDTCARCYFLYKSDAAGKNPRKVTGLRLEDSWMSSRKNGREMVVAGRIGREIRYQLYLVDVKTGDYRPLTRDTSAYYADPCFSPDGKQIVYRYRKSRRDRQEKAELWIMNTDGSGTPRQLTFYPPADTTAPWHAYHAGPPQWNAQAGYITYQSLQNGEYGIYAVTPDGKQTFKLADFPLEAGWHDWSPDGNWLVMDLFDHEQKRFEIGLWNRKTKVFRQLTNTPRAEQSPVFVAENRKNNH
ncbi:MAG: hypothetical protein SFV22_00960 [Saprospiraceae bacterium]|nr:hypothetical protein [Saprospiraceae bacterium]